MNLHSSLIGLVAYSALLLALGYWIGQRGELPPETITKTITVDRARPANVKPADTIVEYIYEEIPRDDLSELCTLAPPELTKSYLITAPSPISIRGRGVRFQYYDPQGQRYREKVYDIPEKRWDYRVDFIGGYDFVTASPVVGLGGTVAYRNVDLFAEAVAGMRSYYLQVGTRIGLVRR